MSISAAITWMLFLGLIPLSFFWLRRAWRIIYLRDFSGVALRHGVPPANVTKFVPITATVNLVAGLVTTATVLAIISGVIEFEMWTAIAGTTIWLKLIADFIISRHAHPIWAKGKK